jgi:hypothetical protein
MDWKWERDRQDVAGDMRLVQEGLLRKLIAAGDKGLRGRGL